MKVVIAATATGRVHLADDPSGLTWCGAQIKGTADATDMSDCRECLMRYRAGRR